MKTGSQACLASTLAAVACAALLGTGPAAANFAGYYAPANWTLTNDNADGALIADGTLVGPGAPATFDVRGGDNQSGSPGWTIVTIVAPANGTVSFDWSDTSFDLPGFDESFFCLNPAGSCSSQLDDFVIPVLSGSFTTSVVAGDVFGIAVNTADNFGGPLVLTISNFSAPADPATNVPEPATLALLGLGLAGLGYARRKRR